MLCTRCNRNRADSLRDDPKLCRAHLGRYAVESVAKDLQLDCWRMQMHSRARRHGLGLQVDVAERFQVDPLAPIRPFVVIVPLELVTERDPAAEGMSSPDWNRTRAAAYQVRAYANTAALGAPQFRQESATLYAGELKDQEAGHVAYLITCLVADLAVRIMEASTSWAS
jgi:hypothetical protein